MARDADHAVAEIRTTPLSVSFSMGERATVRKAAFISDQSVSAFIRAAAVKAAQRVTERDDRKAA